MKRVRVRWSERGFSEETELEAPANPLHPAESIEVKLGVFLIQLAAKGGYLVKVSDVEFHE